MIRLLKIAAGLGGALLVLLILLVTAGYAWLHADAGRRWIEVQLSSASGGQVRIEGLDGVLPFQARARRITLSDATGPWLTADAVRLSIRPTALIRLRLEVEAAEANRVELLRRPEDSRGAEPNGQLARLAQLPLSIEVDRLGVSEIALARPVLGEEARLSIRGWGGLRDGWARLALSIQRLDAPGRAEAALGFDGERLLVDLDLNDPGGLLGRALGAQTDLPASLRASGAGPLEAWRGTVEARLAKATAHADIALDDGQLTLSGSVDPRPLLEPRFAELLPEPLQVEARLLLGRPRLLQRVAIASGPTRLSFEGDLQLDDWTGTGRAELALPEVAVFEPLLGIQMRGAVSGTADFDATAEGQRATILLHGGALSIEAYEAESVTLHAKAERAAGRDAVQVEGTLHGEDLARRDRERVAALPAVLDLVFDGTVFPETGRIEAKRLRLTGEGAEINFAGAAALDGLLDGTARLSLPRLAPFAQLAGLDWAGAVSLEARIEAAPRSGRTRFDLQGEWQQPLTGIPALDAVLGDTVSLAITGAAEFDGTTEIVQAEVQSPSARLSLSGRASRQGPIDARFTLAAEELSKLGTALGTPLAGTAHLSGYVTGTFDAPKLQAEVSSPLLSVSGTDLRELTLSTELTDLAAPQGAATGHVRLYGLETTLATALRFDNGVLSFSKLAVRTSGTTATGNLAVAVDTGSIGGDIAIVAPDLAPWSAFAGQLLSGEARGSLRLNPNGPATGEATASALGIGDLDIAEMRLEIVAPNWRKELAGRVEAQADQVVAGGVSFDTATLRVESGKDAFALRFAGSGSAGDTFTLDSRAVYEPKRQRLILQELSGRYAEKPIELRKPASISLAEGVEVAPFELAWGDASIAGEFALGPRLTGRIAATRLPVQDIAALAGRRDLAGTAQVTLALSGTEADPGAKLTAKIAGLAFLGAAQKGLAGDLAIAAELSRERLVWRADLTSTEAGAAVAASGSLPVAWSDPPFGVSVTPTGPISAEIDGSGTLAPLVTLFGIAEDRASGRYTVDLAIAGTLAEPSLSGTTRVENGRYENFASGAILRDLSLNATGSHDKLRLNLAATDGEGGRLQAEGALDFSGAGLAALDLTAELTEFRAIRRDDVRARATGALALAGPLDGMTLSGEVRLDRMTIHLPEQSRVAAPALEVIEINAPAPDPAPATIVETRRGKPPALEIGLDLKAKLPAVQVEGRGLRSEWSGAVALAGTTTEPKIGGELRLKRGTFALLGKSFTLTEGQIVFGGGAEFDPSLRVIAEREVRDAVARATLTGSLSAPILEFSARPELPVDEVLARLLFDKTAGQVGAAEALQLAQAAAALRGGASSAGVIEEIGRKFGFDRVDVSTVETVDEGGTASEAPALSVGRDLGEDVRVGVEQGIQPGTGSVSVEVDIGKNLSVESRVGAQGRSGLGLRWKYDY